ncbi:glycoside hydrolase family 3 protein [Pseudoalteromonas obscura]|uniref:Glycoside hydrolase family 3 N-terminal domain-containing protein n=1 Tax=Pseudoalteromonas obscura TaxID=3048491 RepID=A0ABT7EIY9_9GAMM|nr:glycoside hydrolase family 3 protein [Pseudoalteromonas sp. P94(2023)]MDK2594996.1 glycoside hydrolase family 3 N-terminal domain-containing protein [Pseudoalteromonas sp. P94(2023)]
MNNLKRTTLLYVCMASLLSACGQSKRLETEVEKGKDPSIWPNITSELAVSEDVESRVATLLADMTIEQKVAQMIQPEIRDITVEDMRKYGFGSYLNGGGAFPNGDKHASVADWVALAESMYQASIDASLDGSTIPTMWGTDAVHGHNNVIGATLFPHNIGLGAANDAKLIEKIAQATAKEVLVTGIDWIFAPTVATVRDDRWGRTYEGYSEDPEIVGDYAYAIVKGLQGDGRSNTVFKDQHVISTVKHFVGDGGTLKGDDQGNNVVSEETLFKIHAQGYVGGLKAGSQSVMASFNSWHGDKIHGNKYLLTTVLKDRMGFDGFVVGDWNGHGQIQGCTNDNCPQAINAGLDMFMAPTKSWKPLFYNTVSQVKDGTIPLSRVNDAVSRILRVKLRAGLFNKPSPAQRLYAGDSKIMGNQQHRALAREAVRKSLVLLKNKAGILPLSPKQNILISGDGANNIGKQSGGWTITWQGTNNANTDFPGGTSIYEGIKQQVLKAGGEITLSVDGSFEKGNKPDVAIVVFGEEPYAEGQGDRPHLAYQYSTNKDLQLIKSLKAQGIPVVSLFISGRPMWVNAELNASDAFVALWLPGSEGGGVADVLLKDQHNSIQYDFSGRLSFSWPNSPTQHVNRFDGQKPLFEYGYGLNYAKIDTLQDNLSELFDVSTSVNEVEFLYDGQPKKPWALYLTESNKKKPVKSNSEQLNGVEYRTIDRFVQEDSIQLSFRNSDIAGVQLLSKHGFPEDLSAYVNSNAYLTFDISLKSGTISTAIVGMNCQGGIKCNSQIKIPEGKLSALNSSWQQIAVPLTCFENLGAEISQTMSPFKLSLVGNAEVGIGKIALRASASEALIIECN